ncbi:hypothetical protein [Streptomyces acidiscabies]|uniref:hypothetical protein n=1 Tax=Streptomyces acidiscabies TaxID=42234 RepID=UPI0038F5F76C
MTGAATAWWRDFRTSGAAIDFAGSTDPRAAELECRVVLSPYQTAMNSAGSLPPQEPGLVANSWQGRFHLETHWWHAAHFAAWGRPGPLARSMDCLPVHPRIRVPDRPAAEPVGHRRTARPAAARRTSERGWSFELAYWWYGLEIAQSWR